MSRYKVLPMSCYISVTYVLGPFRADRVGENRAWVILSLRQPLRRRHIS